MVISEATRVTTSKQTLYNHKKVEYKMSNKQVLRQDQKTAMKRARSGRLFQTRAPSTGKAQSPTAGSRVWLTISDKDKLE